VIKSDWDAKQPQPPSLGVGNPVAPAPPMLFGQKFNFTDAPNRYGLPPFYSLHTWVWKDNLPAPSRCGTRACTVMRPSACT
jgi:hypothetical protein